VTQGADLIDLLDARSGIVCAVGAGGKKSLLRWLAARHHGPVALTGTVFITHVPDDAGFAIAVARDAELPDAVARLGRRSRVAYACPSDKPGRWAGASAATIERIHREGGFAATYVKADGARMRWVKAPADDEPALPACCTTVLPVVSALAIGEPLSSRVAHRIERIGEVLGLRENEIITPTHLGRLIASPFGLLKSTEARRVVPVINMVDDARRETGAREAAEVALAANGRIDRVVLTCLARGSAPLVAVVRR
jgi:probable selenium-dependent hydroxylase accessory protein YqeC